MLQIDLPMPEACNACPLNYDFCWCEGIESREEWEKVRDDWSAQVCEGEHRPEYCPLKEQQDTEEKLVSYIVDNYTGQIVEHCPKCGTFIEKYSPRNPWKPVKYCCYCGQAVKWRR